MTHLGTSDTELQQVGVVGFDLGVDTSDVFSEHVCDISRIDSFENQLVDQHLIVS